MSDKLKVVRASVPSMCKIIFEGKGGSIPKELEGMFTSPGIANTAIQAYIEKKKGLVKDDSKSDTD